MMDDTTNSTPITDSEALAMQVHATNPKRKPRTQKAKKTTKARITIKKHIKKLAKDAKKEIIGMKSAKHGPGNIGTITLKANKGSLIAPAEPFETTAKPKPIPIEEQVKILKTEFEAIKSGMSKHQQDVLNKFLEHNQVISNIRASTEQYMEQYKQDLANHIAYLKDFNAIPGSSIAPNATTDRKAIEWLHNLKGKFTGPYSDSNYPYPPNREETEAIARKWAVKPVGMMGTWLVYIAGVFATAGEMIATKNATLCLSWTVIGLMVGIAICYAIWRG